jgi:hypothetical protein
MLRPMMTEHGLAPDPSTAAGYGRAILKALHRATPAGARTIAPVLQEFVEGLLGHAERTIRNCETLLNGPEADRVGKDRWQIELAYLEFQRRCLTEYLGAVRQRLVRAPRPITVLWRRSWERRYEAALERIEDLAETIVLGLDDAFQREIAERSAAVR